MPEYYSRLGVKDTKANFSALLEVDDHTAMAIANELSRSEIEEAFDWMKRATGIAKAEFGALPVARFLTPQQAKRMRSKLSAIV